MKLRRQLEQWQLEWAQRRGIELQTRPGAPAGAVARLEDNLFEPLDGAAKMQFLAGPGGELERPEGERGHMYSLLSSSALCVNVFQYWRSRPKSALLGALGTGRLGPAALCFEVRLKVQAGWKTHPHADVLMAATGADRWAAGVECKFGEAYDGKPKSGLAHAHAHHAFFREWPALGALAESISPDDGTHLHLHAAQLLKLLLGLKTRYPAGFALIYLWFDIDGPSGRRHREEASEFATRAKSDGVTFLPVSCQELWKRFAESGDAEMKPWLDYMRERYALDTLLKEEP